MVVESLPHWMSSTTILVESLAGGRVGYIRHGQTKSTQIANWRIELFDRYISQKSSFLMNTIGHSL